MALFGRAVPPVPVVRVVSRVRDGLARAHRRSAPGPIALLELITLGFLAPAIQAAATLGVADALADGPKQSGELARAVGANEDALVRLLRLLVGFEVFAQRRDGRYALTPMSRALRADASPSIRDFCLYFGSEFHRDQWTHLEDSIRAGTTVHRARGTSDFFTHIQEHPELGALFDRAMTSIGSASYPALLAACDFGRFGTVVDVGGGKGALLTAILQQHPHLRGVLFDLPHVVPDPATRFTEAGIADRCTIEAGSFFETAPTGGDAYILSRIVHDWPDEQAAAVLRTVHDAMPPGATLLLCELVVPEQQRPHPSHFIDLEMLVATGGRERTAAEFEELLTGCGFTDLRIITTAAPECWLEARRE